MSDKAGRSAHAGDRVTYDVAAAVTGAPLSAIRAEDRADARATGRLGVCLAASGPGACNLLTGIADANSDCTPIVALTGNVPSQLLGKNAFQEADIVGITTPITKESVLVGHGADIPRVVRRAFAIAASNRPGPVLVDLPKDVQQHYPRDPEGRYAGPRIPAGGSFRDIILGPDDA